MPLLHPGDPFPRLTMNVLGGETLTVPDAFAGDFATVLFYRGAWCPYCNDEATTADLAAKHGLAFPVGYGADAPAVAAVTGAFVNPDPVYLQSTGFVLDPAGNVVVSVYSSGAIGRLVPEDVLGLVRYLNGS
jgi:hypothetical protein